jgi:hypothetical protein
MVRPGSSASAAIDYFVQSEWTIQDNGFYDIHWLMLLEKERRWSTEVECECGEFECSSCVTFNKAGYGAETELEDLYNIY